jgi:YVTN family beta-propeller protein
MRSCRRIAAALCVAIWALVSATVQAQTVTQAAGAKMKQLPTGVYLDPIGDFVDLGSMPLAMAVAPGGDYLVVLLAGWREQGIQVVDLKTKQVTQTLTQPAAFIGLAFSPDGQSLYVSGGNDDSIYCYTWNGSSATYQRKINLAVKAPDKPGTRYPAGLAISNNGKLLYVAENLSDSVAVIDLSTSTVVQRLRTGHYPYAIAVSSAGRVYVSAWGGQTVTVFRAGAGGKLNAAGRISVGRHPSALLLNPSGSRLFVALATTDQVAIVDTRRRRVLAYLSTSAPGAPHEGSTPNALALSPNGSRLFVAEADSNAVAVFNLPVENSGGRISRVPVQLAGRIPMDWYPTALLEHENRLLVLTGKGHGTGPNPKGPQPGRGVSEQPTQYTLGQTNGTLRLVQSDFTQERLRELTRRVATANGWTQRKPVTRRYPPFKQVVYIIKENRTYDQVLGDMPEGDGDPGLVFFGREVSPNHHALAERFGLFDRFFANAEVSSQGHMWSTAAYVTDYGEKTIPSLYSDRGPDSDEMDMDAPSTGFLWDLARKKGITFRNYGEWVVGPGFSKLRPGLGPHTSHNYPPYDLTIPDQRRADAWISELKKFVRKGRMPQLEIMHLPGDHTAGGRAGLRTPRACMADNDLALGRIVEALSRSPFWKDTVILVVEDDAQAGPDHIDSHRAPFFVISAYNRAGTSHRFVNTSDVVAAIEDILGLGRLSQYDYFSRPLSDVFAAEPDLRPYTAIVPRVPMDEKNPDKGKAAEQSAALDFSSPDRINDALFNQILWSMIKGSRTMPPTQNRSQVQLLQSAH